MEASSLMVPRCEDCEGEVEPGVEPLGLFRPVEGALKDRIWDATKQKWVRRRGAARAGGKRYREYMLCRRCRAIALQERSFGKPFVEQGKTGLIHGRRGGQTTENGVRRALKVTERVPPKKGGRPRLLDVDELAALYRIYQASGHSIGELARQLNATREKGTETGYYQSILYGWRKLGYELRPRGVQIAISRFGTDGTKSKPRKVRCTATVKHGARKGQRCTQFARRAGGPFCFEHQPGKER